jgi:hypothetical protein
VEKMKFRILLAGHAKLKYSTCCIGQTHDYVSFGEFQAKGTKKPATKIPIATTKINKISLES